MQAQAPRRTDLGDTFALLVVAAVILVADQLTKALVVANIDPGERIDVIGDVVQLWHAQNAGAAFSLFQGGLLLFLVVSVVALAMVAYFHRAFRGESRWLQLILGMVLGGTLGNLVDRIRLGYVTDFLSVGIGQTRWPTFNVADSALVVGIGLLVIYLAFLDHGREHQPA
ncbi:MAG TPA: signal peptidase II [Candidatus Limnocylindria bacterium]|jgi:signal peptidase II|nr:signal peptidase II [Candidatus Limnocylindria bacterium]